MEFIPNKYKFKELLEKLQTEIRSVGLGLQNTRVLYDRETDRVTITGNQRKFMISSYNKNSLLPMLGFANQIITNKQEMEERENCILDPEIQDAYHYLMRNNYILKILDLL